MYGNGKTVSFRRALVVVSLFWLPLGLTTPAASQGSSTLTTIDVPGAGTGAQQGTAVTAVDAVGDIALCALPGAQFQTATFLVRAPVRGKEPFLRPSIPPEWSRDHILTEARFLTALCAPSMAQ